MIRNNNRKIFGVFYNNKFADLELQFSFDKTFIADYLIEKNIRIATL